MFFFIEDTAKLVATDEYRNIVKEFSDFSKKAYFPEKKVKQNENGYFRKLNVD